MNPLTHVYLLRALFRDPFTGDGHMEKTDSVVYPTKAAATAQIETFRKELMNKMPDSNPYSILINVEKYKIIYEEKTR